MLYRLEFGGEGVAFVNQEGGTGPLPARVEVDLSIVLCRSGGSLFRTLNLAVYTLDSRFD